MVFNIAGKTARAAGSSRLLYISLFPILLISLLAGCGRSRDDQAPAMFVERNGEYSIPAGSPLRTHLQVAPVLPGDQSGAVSIPAVVEADPTRVVNILAPLTGRVTSLKVQIGDHVKKGQVLAVIASGDMAQAATDADKANDTAMLAQKALDRAKGVLAAGGAANKDMEAVQSAYNQAKAEQVRTRARLEAIDGFAGGHNHQMMLVSPLDGVVTALTIAPGAQVSDPTATLLTVTNTDRVFVTANLAEDNVGRATVGSEVRIALSVFPAQSIRGRVFAVNTVLEPDTRRQKVRIALDNRDGKLLPNMYATVFFAGGAGRGVVVPQSALLMNNDSITVLEEIRPWVFRRQAIHIGDESDTTAQVLVGLKAGDRVVVRGGVLLND
jgi:cobalt-zinc-cadmium efflux system membrane fusion protein